MCWHTFLHELFPNFSRIDIFTLWNYVTRNCLPIYLTVRHFTPVSQVDMYLKYRQYIE
jgi:hypothetical protein